MPKRWINIAVTLLAFAIVTAACGKPQLPENHTAGAAGRSVPELAEQPENIKREAIVKTYFGNAQGDRLVERTAKISYSGREIYLAALNALKTSPEEELVPLFQGVTFLSAELADDTLTVDLSLDENGRLGASGEQLALKALQMTLFQFDEINRIEILVEGERTDSLMGHVDLPHPITRSSM